MRAVLAVVIALAIGGAIAAAVYVQKSQVQREQAATAGPPADAKFIEAGVTPQQIIAGIQRKNAAPSHYIGMWVPEPGWDMGVDDVSPSSDGGLGIKQWRTEGSGPLGGGYWLCAVVPASSDIRKTDHVFISGRIDTVESYNDGGIMPAYRIVIRNAKAVNQTKR